MLHGVRVLLHLLPIFITVIADACPKQRLLSRARLPLRTRLGAVVDKDGCPVSFACVNWYGAHMELFSVDGLNQQPLARIVERIVDMGFNCVRVPFSLQLFDEDPVVPYIALSANPELQGIRGVAMFDTAIKQLTDAGLMVILNNHNSAAGWCCNSASEEGLWHTSKYPLESWLQNIANVSKRYLSNPMVVGFDLRNEIHDVGNMKVTWGTSNDALSDWRVASTMAANIVQDVNPEILVIITGLCFGYELRPLRKSPPNMTHPHKLVYTSHTYSWTLWWHVVKHQLQLQGLDGMRGGNGAWLLASKRMEIGGCVAAGCCVVLVIVAANAARHCKEARFDWRLTRRGL